MTTRRRYIGLKRFTYVGCKGARGLICDVCGAKPEIFHYVKTADGIERGACRACAEEMVTTGGGTDGGMPTWCEERSKKRGGFWYSRDDAWEWLRK